MGEEVEIHLYWLSRNIPILENISLWANKEKEIGEELWLIGSASPDM